MPPGKLDNGAASRGLVQLGDGHCDEAVAAVADRCVDRVEVLDNDLVLLDALRVGADDGDQQHARIVARAADGPAGRFGGILPR